MNQNQYFFQYQLDYLNDESMIKIVEKSRRIGGTYMQSFEDVRDIVMRKEYTPGRPVERVYFASKDELAGKEYIEYCGKWAKIFNVAASDLGSVVIDENNGIKALVIEFGNGGKIYALSSSPTAFNSKGGKIVWDEVALHKDQRSMWAGAKPAALWGYPIRMLSTHKGVKTLFYKFCRDTENGKTGWSHHKVTIYRAVKDGLADKILGRKLTEQERNNWIEQCRKDCHDEDIFQEDFNCNARDATTAYLSYDLIATCTKTGICVPFHDLANLKGNLYAGWDIARNRDLSAIILLERCGLQLIQRYKHCMEKTPFPKQKDFAHEILKLPNLRRMCIDKTGMGIPIVEDMQKMHGTFRVEGVTFTNAVKEDLAVSIKKSFEDISLIINDDVSLIESCHSIAKTTTSAGNTRYDADRTDQTGHADEFWALALARHAAGANTGPTWAHAPQTKWNEYEFNYNNL
jgi:phage FluMu gp28-like protein